MNINTMQRCVIVAGVLAIIGTGTYLPWVGTIGMIGEPKTTVRRSAGYHSIFTAPGPTDKSTFNATFGDIENYDAYDYDSYHERKVRKFRDTLQYEIDRTRLLLEWLMVVLVTAGLALASKRKAPTRTTLANGEGDLGEGQRTLQFRVAVLRFLRSPRTYILLLSTVACLAVTYYFVIALPRHNQASLELERERISAADARERADETRRLSETRRKEEAEREAKRVEEQAKRDAEIAKQEHRKECDTEADTAYWEFLRRNAPWVQEENGYRPSQVVRDSAEREKRATLTYCYKRYGLR